MITPADIESKEFSRAKKGYDEQEVDQYLDLIILEIERLLKENKNLSEEIVRLKEEIKKQAGTESSVYETLEAAKSLMNDIAASSERRAEVIIKNAELEADNITREAKENISRYTEEGNRLLYSLDSLKERYKRMLQDEISRIEFSSGGILKEFEKDFLSPQASDDTKSQTRTVTMSQILQGGDAQKKTDLTKTMVVEK